MMNYEVKLIDFGYSKYFVKKNKKRNWMVILELVFIALLKLLIINMTKNVMNDHVEF
jgi:hypothetical protein